MTFRQTLATLGLAATLGLGALSNPASAYQAVKDAPAKDPTEGFFDIPVDPNAVAEPSYGVPSYLVTSALGGMALFILCKSARRG